MTVNTGLKLIPIRTSPKRRCGSVALTECFCTAAPSRFQVFAAVRRRSLPLEFNPDHHAAGPGPSRFHGEKLPFSSVAVTLHTKGTAQ